MACAARIGISAAEWRQMTPKELHIWADAWLEKRQSEKRAEKVRIYNLAGLTRTMIWARHAPSFEAVFPEPTPKVMDDNEMYKTVEALNALFGGKVE